MPKLKKIVVAITQQEKCLKPKVVVVVTETRSIQRWRGVAPMERCNYLDFVEKIAEAALTFFY